MADPQTNQQGQGQPKQNKGDGGNKLTIHDFACTTPKNDSLITFRVMRGGSGVPNQRAELWLGTQSVRFHTQIKVGGTGADANDPLIITTGNSGIGQKKVDFTIFDKKLTRLSLLIDGTADTKPVDIPSDETVLNSAGAKAKPKRFKAFFKGQEITAGCTFEGLNNLFTVRLSSFGSDGKPNPEEMVVISENGKFDVLNQNSTVITTNVNDYTITTLATPIKGGLTFSLRFVGACRIFTIVHGTSGESTSFTFHIK